MTRTIGRLKALRLDRLTKPGLHADGGGLCLQITSAAARSWVYRFMLAGRARAMGLGSFPDVSLAEARERAAECRRLRANGIDPIEARDGDRAKARTGAAQSITFKECAERYIESHKAGWRNPKHAAQWTATLASYAHPAFGGLPVQSIDTGLVLKALEPIWSTKTETATRVRGRIESVLDWATARGYRRGENPARWRGHLDNLLPKRSKVAAVEHHAALRYAEVGAFMSALRDQPGVGAKALELVILTAARTGEAIGAQWSEIDLDAAVWTVPGERMKAGREHRVPLSKPAVAILRKMQGASKEFVFPGGKRGRALSNMALTAVLKRMGRDDLTVHGFRSSFRDWAAEQTNFPREIAEAALAHTLKDKVEAAYRRGDAIEKRKKLMTAWAEFCARPATKATVTPIRRGTGASGGA
jgi:integrase